MNSKRILGGLALAVTAAVSASAWAGLSDSGPTEPPTDVTADAVTPTTPVAPVADAPTLPPAPKVQPSPPEDQVRAAATPPDVPSAHQPQAMRTLAGALEQWTADPVNADARARYLGIDCSAAPCVLAIEYNQSQDGTFLGRTQVWLTTQARSGPVRSVPHLLNADLQRVWFFWSPHAEGTAENHAYEEGAHARIAAEIQGLPQYNPSAGM